MPNFSDGLEATANASMDAIDRLSDFSSLAHHGCLTLAQCAALLVLAKFTQEGTTTITGELTQAQKAYVDYLRIAGLDLAAGKLDTIRHPHTFLPLSQYKRLLSAGMYGADGLDAPVPDMNWLLDLDDCVRWYATHGIQLNRESLENLADLARKEKFTKALETHSPGWTVIRPKRFQGYSEPLFNVLQDAHNMGQPLPTVHEVLGAFRINQPAQIAKLLPGQGFDYYTADGNTKSADLKAIREVIRKMTTPRPL
ncbi:hypothetical protein [Polaromonas naphthalenivorans]|nr:hypothetical protein [Polaromonas naphthalenivorans]